MQKYTQFNKGYVMLFSILVTGIILSIVIGIANITFRQRIFTQQVRQSTTAFYAAEAGLDCFLALDNVGYFGTEPSMSTKPNPAEIDCDPYSSIGPITAAPVDNLGTGEGVTYSFTYEQSNLVVTHPRTCASVVVTKYIDMGPNVPNTANIYRHTFDVKGYNLPCDDIHTHFWAVYATMISPFQNSIVERSLSYSYETEE